VVDERLACAVLFSTGRAMVVDGRLTSAAFFNTGRAREVGEWVAFAEGGSLSLSPFRGGGPTHNLKTNIFPNSVEITACGNAIWLHFMMNSVYMNETRMWSGATKLTNACIAETYP
jgi:hypothetical protein